MKTIVTSDKPRPELPVDAPLGEDPRPWPFRFGTPLAQSAALVEDDGFPWNHTLPDLWLGWAEVGHPETSANAGASRPTRPTQPFK